MKIINGNNIDVLKQYPDNYFDSIVTDPPYGLGKEPNAADLMKDWIEHGYHEVGGSGFMGKEWDAFVPQPIFWKEVYRVLKPGGHVLAFYGTRTYDWGVMSMRFAGFEVRDCIQWLYGSGFPKSHNISKALDKMEGAEREVIAKSKNGAGASPQKINNHAKGDTGIGMLDGSGKEFDITAPSTDAAKQWDGWGTALKPANEPIVLARKPLEKGLSIAENILKWGVGGINIDASRIGNLGGTERGEQGERMKDIKTGFRENNEIIDINKGRFPANIILTHHPDCVCKGTKKVKGSNSKPQDIGKGRDGDFTNGIYGAKQSKVATSHTDIEGNEEVEDWDCHEDCPIRILDEQSGTLKSGAIKKSYEYKDSGYSLGKASGSTKQIRESSQGGASRFFYVAKASKSERNKGLDDFEEKPLAFSNQAKAELKRGNADYDGGDAKGHGNSIRHLKNFHPTVKPIKLMQYLVRMVTPPNGIVLDPFVGSGTTGIACKLEGFDFVGIEQDPEYTKIAEARINNLPIENKGIEDKKPKFIQPTLF